MIHMDSLDKQGLITISRNFKNKGSLYAILAALMVAGYTLEDKVAISRIEPFVYFYLYTCVVAIMYATVVFKI